MKSQKDHVILKPQIELAVRQVFENYGEKYELQTIIPFLRESLWEKALTWCKERWKNTEPQEQILLQDVFVWYALEHNKHLLWNVIEFWLNERPIPPRAGGITGDSFTIFWGVCASLRSHLHQYFMEHSFQDIQNLTPRQQTAGINLWRKIFLNDFSPLQLRPETFNGDTITPGRQFIRSKTKNIYPDLLIISMYEPFAAGEIPLQTKALWLADIPLFSKMVLLFWMIALPYFNASEKYCTRFLTHVSSFCEVAQQEPQTISKAFFIAFMEEAMASFWRTSYLSGNSVKELSIFGDYIHFFMKKFNPNFAEFKNEPKKNPAQPLRIGYISRNFCKQAVGYYMINRIIHHDKEGFDVHTFALGTRDDEITALFKKHSKHFIQHTKLDSIERIAQSILDSKLDILIYGDIGMDPITYQLAGLQLAPIQCALVGHGTTTGLPTIQYYISGDFESRHGDDHYREKLIRLPNLGAAQYPPEPSNTVITRAALTIPEDAILFISCANGIKHGVKRDRILMEILRQVPNAYILLKPFQNSYTVDLRLTERIKQGARQAKVEERLRILPPFAHAKDVMSLLKIADIQLDSYPYGGWTTNMEALYAGLPIVTQEGDMMRNRWGASMLRALGIKAGIARDEAEYIAWSVRLAKDTVLRSSVKKTILERTREVLFNGPVAQKHYENQLQSIYEETAH